MWEDAGGRVFDYSGHGNHGVITGADWTPDGLNFIRTNSNYVSCGQVVSGYPFTLHTTIKLDDLTASMFVSLSSGSVNTYHAIYYDSVTNTITARSYDGTIRDAKSINTIYAQQYTVTGVWESASSRKLYIDGVYIAENTQTESGIGYATTKLGVSADSTPYGYLDGLMKDAYIYNYAPSAAQVKFLYDNPYFMFQIPEELYGYVATAAGWTGTINGISSSSKINGITIINKINGV